MRLFFAAGEADYSYWAPEFSDVLVAFSPKLKEGPRHPLWFLDSGAYSAMQLGLDPTDTLDQYIEYLTRGPGKEHQRYAVMDVIGAGWEKTWTNDQKMRAAGLSPIACVHEGEPPKTILKYLDAGVRDLALGGSAGRGSSRAQIDAWTKKVFHEIYQWMKLNDQPLPRIHAFGQTSVRFLTRYPFYSADSTNWLTSHRFGEILYFDPQRLRIAGIHPKLFGEGSAMLELRLPLAAKDGYLVPDARAYRSAWNINVVLALTDFLTQLWEDRGIVWEDAEQRITSTAAQRAYLTERWPEVMRDQSLTRTPVWAGAS